MLGLYIGLLALGEALRPGMQYPKTVVLVPAALSFFLDVLLIGTLARHLVHG